MSLGGCSLLLVARAVVIQRSRWWAHARQGAGLVPLTEDVHDLPQPRSNSLQSWRVIRGGDAGTEKVRAAPATPAASTAAATPDSATAFEDLRHVRSRFSKMHGFFYESLDWNRRSRHWDDQMSRFRELSRFVCRQSVLRPQRISRLWVMVRDAISRRFK